MHVLFFSRGRGFGHASPDLAIGRALRRTAAGNLRISYASYSSGGYLLSRTNEEFYDMGLPLDDNPYTETLIACFNCLQEMQPDIVLVHEEFAAIVAAAALRRPSIFISDWMPSPGGLAAASLAHADMIVVFEHPGVFNTRYRLKSNPLYLGRFCRSTRFSRKDRDAIRAKFEVPFDAVLVVACPGSGLSEDQSPLVPLLLPAFEELSVIQKRLLWITKRDFEYVERIASSFADVRVTQYVDDLQEILAASDVVVTRGSHVTLVEAAAMGVPTIAISHAVNPMDDMLGARIKSNLVLNARSLDASTLSSYMCTAIRNSASITPLETIDEYNVARVLQPIMHSLLEQKSSYDSGKESAHGRSAKTLLVG